jgi:DNA-binding MarR family transcriptional regulator
MPELTSEVRVVVARLRNLFVDLARRGAFANPLDELPHAELEPRQVQALWWLRAEGFLTVNGLAERMGMAMPPMTRLLDRLEERGLVTRQRGSGGDKRHVMVRVTAKGGEVAEAADAIVQERLARLLLPMVGEDRSALLDLLERWVEALSRPSGDDSHTAA